MSSAVAHRMYFALVACCSEIPADRMSFSKNLIASATCSIRPANDARRRATRRRPRSCSSGPAARMIGLALGATRSSTRKAGPCPSAEAAGVGGGAALWIHSSAAWVVGAGAWVDGAPEAAGAAGAARGVAASGEEMAAALWELQEASAEAGSDSPAERLGESGRPDWDV